MAAVIRSILALAASAAALAYGGWDEARNLWEGLSTSKEEEGQPAENSKRHTSPDNEPVDSKHAAAQSECKPVGHSGQKIRGKATRKAWLQDWSTDPAYRGLPWHVRLTSQSSAAEQFKQSFERLQEILAAHMQPARQQAASLSSTSPLFLSLLRMDAASNQEYRSMTPDTNSLPSEQQAVGGSMKTGMNKGDINQKQLTDSHTDVYTSMLPFMQINVQEHAGLHVTDLQLNSSAPAVERGPTAFWAAIESQEADVQTLTSNSSDDSKQTADCMTTRTLLDTALHEPAAPSIPADTSQSETLQGTLSPPETHSLASEVVKQPATASLPLNEHMMLVPVQVSSQRPARTPVHTTARTQPVPWATSGTTTADINSTVPTSPIAPAQSLETVMKLMQDNPAFRSASITSPMSQASPTAALPERVTCRRFTDPVAVQLRPLMPLEQTMYIDTHPAVCYNGGQQVHVHRSSQEIVTSPHTDIVAEPSFTAMLPQGELRVLSIACSQQTEPHMQPPLISVQGQEAGSFDLLQPSQQQQLPPPPPLPQQQDGDVVTEPVSLHVHQGVSDAATVTADQKSAVNWGGAADEMSLDSNELRSLRQSSACQSISDPGGLQTTGMHPSPVKSVDPQSTDDAIQDMDLQALTRHELSINTTIKTNLQPLSGLRTHSANSATEQEALPRVTHRAEKPPEETAVHVAANSNHSHDAPHLHQHVNLNVSCDPSQQHEQQPKPQQDKQQPHQQLPSVEEPASFIVSHGRVPSQTSSLSSSTPLSDIVVEQAEQSQQSNVDPSHPVPEQGPVPVSEQVFAPVSEHGPVPGLNDLQDTSADTIHQQQPDGMALESGFDEVVDMLPSTMPEHLASPGADDLPGRSNTCDTVDLQQPNDAACGSGFDKVVSVTLRTTPEHSEAVDHMVHANHTQTTNGQAVIDVAEKSCSLSVHGTINMNDSCRDAANKQVTTIEAVLETPFANKQPQQSQTSTSSLHTCQQHDMAQDEAAGSFVKQELVAASLPDAEQSPATCGLLDTVRLHSIQQPTSQADKNVERAALLPVSATTQQRSISHALDSAQAICERDTPTNQRKAAVEQYATHVAADLAQVSLTGAATVSKQESMDTAKQQSTERQPATEPGLVQQQALPNSPKAFHSPKLVTAASHPMELFEGFSNSDSFAERQARCSSTGNTGLQISGNLVRRHASARSLRTQSSHSVRDDNAETGEAMLKAAKAALCRPANSVDVGLAGSPEMALKTAPSVKLSPTGSELQRLSSVNHAIAAAERMLAAARALLQTRPEVAVTSVDSHSLPSAFHVQLKPVADSNLQHDTDKDDASDTVPDRNGAQDLIQGLPTVAAPGPMMKRTSRVPSSRTSIRSTDSGDQATCSQNVSGCSSPFGSKQLVNAHLTTTLSSPATPPARTLSDGNQRGLLATLSTRSQTEKRAELQAQVQAHQLPEALLVQLFDMAMQTDGNGQPESKAQRDNARMLSHALPEHMLVQLAECMENELQHDTSDAPETHELPPASNPVEDEAPDQPQLSPTRHTTNAFPETTPRRKAIIQRLMSVFHRGESNPTESRVNSEEVGDVIESVDHTHPSPGATISPNKRLLEACKSFSLNDLDFTLAIAETGDSDAAIIGVGTDTQQQASSLVGGNVTVTSMQRQPTAIEARSPGTSRIAASRSFQLSRPPKVRIPQGNDQVSSTDCSPMGPGNLPSAVETPPGIIAGVSESHDGRQGEETSLSSRCGRPAVSPNGSTENLAPKHGDRNSSLSRSQSSTEWSSRPAVLLPDRDCSVPNFNPANHWLYQTTVRRYASPPDLPTTPELEELHQQQHSTPHLDVDRLPPSVGQQGVDDSTIWSAYSDAGGSGYSTPPIVADGTSSNDSAGMSRFSGARVSRMRSSFECWREQGVQEASQGQPWKGSQSIASIRERLQRASIDSGKSYKARPSFEAWRGKDDGRPSFDMYARASVDMRRPSTEVRQSADLKRSLSFLLFPPMGDGLDGQTNEPDLPADRWLTLAPETAKHVAGLLGGPAAWLDLALPLSDPSISYSGGGLSPRCTDDSSHLGKHVVVPLVSMLPNDTSSNGTVLVHTISSDSQASQSWCSSSRPIHHILHVPAAAWDHTSQSQDVMDDMLRLTVVNPSAAQTVLVELPKRCKGARVLSLPAGALQVPAPQVDDCSVTALPETKAGNSQIQELSVMLDWSDAGIRCCKPSNMVAASSASAQAGKPRTQLQVSDQRWVRRATCSVGPSRTHPPTITQTDSEDVFHLFLHAEEQSAVLIVAALGDSDVSAAQKKIQLQKAACTYQQTAVRLRPANTSTETGPPSGGVVESAISAPGQIKALVEKFEQKQVQDEAKLITPPSSPTAGQEYGECFDLEAEKEKEGELIRIINVPPQHAGGLPHSNSFSRLADLEAENDQSVNSHGATESSDGAAASSMSRVPWQNKVLTSASKIPSSPSGRRSPTRVPPLPAILPFQNRTIKSPRSNLPSQPATPSRSHSPSSCASGASSPMHGHRMARLAPSKSQRSLGDSSQKIWRF